MRRGNKSGPVGVTVVCSAAPRQVREFDLSLGPGATVSDALAACALRREFPELDAASVGIGIWGRRIKPSHLLRNGDRIEVCRPLVVDPKKARRERFARQGARASGLFAGKRAGAKAGY